MAASTPSGTAINAATAVTNTVPPIAGQMPPPGNWVMTGRFFVRKLQLTIDAPLITT